QRCTCVRVAMCRAQKSFVHLVLVAWYTPARSCPITGSALTLRSQEGAPMDSIADVRVDLEAAASESDYTAVNTLWLALLKLANMEQGKSELVRMVTLVGRIPEEAVE